MTKPRLAKVRALFYVLQQVTKEAAPILTQPHDGEVWYSDLPNGDLNGDVDFGTLKVGETTTVKTKGTYFYVCIKNSRGKMQLSKPKPVNSSATVSASDMY